MRKEWRIHNLGADFMGLASKLGVDPVVIEVF